MSQYFQEFKLVEIQQTFYKPPRIQTVEKWRIMAPEYFEFTVKCWQLITHSPSSPTYRKAGIKISNEHLERYGNFRPTEEVFQAWDTVRDICEVLNTKICLIQCPASFRPTKENIENMYAFFSAINRADITIAWEPRGKSWTEEKVHRICDELDLIHVVDPFAQRPATLVGSTAYLRLHGAPPGKKMYSYQYTDTDLRFLLKELNTYEVNQVYVLFNNISKAYDAKRLLAMVE